MKKYFASVLLISCLVFGSMFSPLAEADEFTDSDNTHVYSGGWMPLYGEPIGTGLHWTSYRLFQNYPAGIYAYIWVHGYDPVTDVDTQYAYAQDQHRVGPYAGHTHQCGAH
ncbi:MAG: hypothetical protein SOR89_05470 [Ndongobacter sp.]|nr:hypothetical protein [Ndongobacter sp.]